MFGGRLVAPERAFQNQKISTARERGQPFRISGVRRIDQRLSVIVCKAKRHAFASMWCGKSLSANSRQHFKITVSDWDFVQLDWKGLGEQSIVIGFVDRSQKVFDSRTTEDPEQLLTRLGLRRPLQSKQK